MKLLLAFLLFLTFTFSILPSTSYAQIGLDRGKQPMGIKPTARNSASTLSTLIKNLVTLFYSIGALGFTIMILWGSVNWILSGGDKEAVSNARKRITTALIGLFLLALSFPIINIIAQISGIDILGNLPLKNLSTP
jgi:hypothetical protein